MPLVYLRCRQHSIAMFSWVERQPRQRHKEMEQGLRQCHGAISVTWGARLDTSPRRPQAKGTTWPKSTSDDRMEAENSSAARFEGEYREFDKMLPDVPLQHSKNSTEHYEVTQIRP